MNHTEIYTIGHSNHAIDQFVTLLEQHEIKALVDVRRFPSSRRLPHFNRPNMAATLKDHGIKTTGSNHRGVALPGTVPVF